MASSNGLSNSATSTIAILRVLIGGGVLIAPSHTLPLFGIPLATQTTILARMCGIRELILAGLLWSARTDSNPTLKSAASDGEVRRELRRALMAGLVADAVDVCSAVVGVMEGTLEGPAIGWIGGGGALGVALGIVALRGF